MSLKKIVGIGVAIIVSVSLVIVLSFVVMLNKLEKLEHRENYLIDIKDTLNNRYLELIAWMDKMNDHVVEDWPFEGELDHKKSALGKWIESYGPMSAEEEKIITDLNLKHQALFQSANELVRIEGLESKQEYYLDKFRPDADSIKPLIGGLANIYQEKLEDVHEKRSSFLRKSGFFIIVSSAVTIVLIILSALALFILILRPVSHLSSKITEVGRGDLGVSVDYKAKNEIGDIAQNFNKMVQAFNKIVRGILSSSTEVVSSVDVLRERAEKTSDEARNQHSQATQAATAVEEMSQTIADIAQNASIASETSSEAIKTAELGKEVTDGAVVTVDRAYTSTVELSKEIEKLNMSVSEIGEIVTVINGIADQTNLLALNAAIEASRAGEQGRGFAVVADEVRKLAESTIKATAEISEKIGVVQEESEQTKKSMEEASNVVTMSTEYIKKVGDSLQSIVESVIKVRDQVAYIATAVDEQSAAADQVTKNMEETSAISDDMQKMSGDVLQEINSLTNIAQELKNSIAGFKINGSDYDQLRKELVHNVHKQDVNIV